MIIDHIQVRETILLDEASGIRVTGDGYMVARPRVARTGIQIYAGKEVGRPEMDRVRVWRPEDEVFDKAAMASLAHRPITNDHPKEAVTAANWRKYAVGNVGDEVARDGEFIRVPIVLMDGGVIKDVRDGKKEISLGYAANLEWRKGITPQNEAYDAVQTSIRINHLAIVDAARGGSKLVVGDVRPEEPNPAQREEVHPMNDVTAKNLKMIDVDGIQVELSDIAASVVLRRMKALEGEIGDLRSKLEKETEGSKKKSDDSNAQIATLTTQVATKDAEVTTMKQQLKDAEITPAKLDQMVKDRAAVIGKAQAIIGDTLVVTDKTEGDMRRQVVAAKIGDVAKAWDDNQIKASFDTLTAGVKLDDTQARSSAANLINASFQNNQQVADANKKIDASITAYDKRISDQWKTPAA
jgi:hypothetical protein